MRTIVAVFASVCVLLRTTAAPAEDVAPPKITYDDQVRPILREHCFTCHNRDTKKSDLAIDSFAGLMQGGAGGAVIEPGDPASSRLWALVSHADEPKMPPNQDRLADAKLEIIKQWILGGGLENSGSAAKVKKPVIDLAASAAAGPAAAAAMPENVCRQPVVYAARAGAVTALATAPGAPLAAVAGQQQISLYRTDTGTLAGVLPFPEGIPYVLRFSRSGALLLAGGGLGARSGKAVVYDVRTGQRVFEVGDELDVVLAADINAAHTQIALGGPQRVVRIYSTADGALVQEIRKHTEWIYAVEYSPDGVLLATGDRGGGLFVWEADTAREYQNLVGHKGAITDVSWRLDSNLLASGSEDGTIKLWELENGGQVKNWNAHGGGVTSVKFARDGRLVSTGRDALCKLWDAGGAQQRAFEPFGDLALRSAVTHDGARVVAGDWSGQVRLLDAADGKLLGQLPPNPPTLQMVVAERTAQVQAATAAVDKATADLAAAQAALAAIADPAAKLAAEQALAALQAAQVQAQQALAAAQAALATASAEQAAFEQSRGGASTP